MTTKTTTQTKTSERVLSAEEEKVVRMRHGLRAPDEQELEFIDETHPELAEQLRAIEKRAMTAVAPRSNDTKRKIVKSLRTLKRR